MNPPQIAERYSSKEERGLVKKGYALQGCRSARSDGLPVSQMPPKTLFETFIETLFFLEQYRELKRKGRDPRVVMGFAFTQHLYALPELF